LKKKPRKNPRQELKNHIQEKKGAGKGFYPFGEPEKTQKRRQGTE